MKKIFFFVDNKSYFYLKSEGILSKLNKFKIFFIFEEKKFRKNRICYPRLDNFFLISK